MEEFVDILDERGAKSGEVAAKAEAHRRGLWHRCFHCWIVCSDSSDLSGERSLILQRRAAAKETWPGYLDVSVGGHLSAGEGPLDGRREISEEVGLSVGPERLISLGERRVELEIPQGRDREFHDVFLLFDDTPPGELRLQAEEVDSLVTLALSDAEALARGESIPAVEYRAGARETVDVEPSQLVAGQSEYLGSIVRAVRDAIRRIEAGESLEDLRLA